MIFLVTNKIVSSNKGRSNEKETNIIPKESTISDIKKKKTVDDARYCEQLTIILINSIYFFFFLFTIRPRSSSTKKTGRRIESITSIVSKTPIN